MIRTSVLVPVVAVVTLLASHRTGYAQAPPAPVSVSRIVERDIMAGQSFVGSVMPYKRSAVGSAVDGRVTDFPVNEGDFVRKGDTLAQLLTATIKLEHKGAEGELALRQAELSELENGSRPEEIERAEALMLSAKAAMEFHSQRRQRMQTLFERSALNEDELQAVISESVKARQDHAAAVAAHKLAVKGPRPERIAQARARVATQQALVDKLADQIRKYTIMAPFDGFVLAEHTEVGQWVKQGELVAEVVALNEVDIEAQVLEKHIPHVRKGMSVRIEVPALPTEVLTGTVDHVVPQADLRARTFPVRIRVINSISSDGPLLKSGMLARAMLPTGVRQRSMLVPKDALVLGGREPVVFVVDAESDAARSGKSRPVPVTLGVADGRLIQVRGELQADQWVVVRGNERLRPGQQVEITEILEPEAEPKARAIRSSDD